MNLSEQISLIEEALLKNEYNLPKEILDIYGLTSPRTQAFMNLIAKNNTVLEVGAFCGATTFAMAFDNNSRILTIDNWCGGDSIPVNGDFHNEGINPKEYFLSKIGEYKNVDYIEGDIFSREVYNEIISKKFDIIYYDASHELNDIICFMMLYYPMFKDSIIIFDDWNFESVRVGVNEALSELGLVYKYKKEILTNGESKETFWNGLSVFIF